ncbi:MAG: pentapeptide repeat-containing protein [Prochloraceae cyanobacterium]
MVDQQHLQLLKQSVTTWNEWRKDNPDIEIDLIAADLTQANLSGANLSGVDLTQANLSEADLTQANLSGADLTQINLSFVKLKSANLSFTYISEANLSLANLSEADLSGAYLGQANLSFADLTKADLSFANLSGANLNESDLVEAKLRFADLSGANLSEVNLERANLREADLIGAKLNRAKLSEANLSFVNFSGANLAETEALFTNFEGATFTGACIENWQLNSQTILNEVICDYVYLHSNEQEDEWIYEKRLPEDPDKNFAPGEFQELFQKPRETVKLIFRDNIDWQVFLTCFKELQSKKEYSELFIQAIETELDGSVVIRIEVTIDSNKSKIEENFWHEYKQKITVEVQHKDLQNPDIEVEKKDPNKLLEIIETIAEHPRDIADLSKQPKDDLVTETDNKYTPEQQQDILQIATEIYQLLEQLSAIYPTPTTTEKLEIITKAAEQIENNLELKELKDKVISLLKLGAAEVLQDKINHPLSKILLTTIEQW